MKFKQQLKQATATKKQHYKLYKSGKTWLIMGIATIAFGAFGITSNVSAETTSTTGTMAITATSTTTSSTANSTTSSIATPSSATSLAASSAATPSSAVTPSSAASSSVPASSAATSVAASSAADTTQSIAPASSTAAVKTTSLGAATAAEVATAKSSAASDAAQTGQAQQVTAALAASSTATTTGTAKAPYTTENLEATAQQTTVNYVDSKTGKTVATDTGRLGSSDLDDAVKATTADLAAQDYTVDKDTYNQFNQTMEDGYQYALDGWYGTPKAGSNMNSILGISLEQAKQTVKDLMTQWIQAYNDSLPTTATDADKIFIYANGAEGQTLGEATGFTPYLDTSISTTSVDISDKSALIFKLTSDDGQVVAKLSPFIGPMFTSAEYWTASKVLSIYGIVPIIQLARTTGDMTFDGTLPNGGSGSIWFSHAVAPDTVTVTVSRPDTTTNTITYLDTATGQVVPGDYGVGSFTVAYDTPITLDASTVTNYARMPIGYHYATGSELGSYVQTPTVTSGVNGTNFNVYVAKDAPTEDKRTVTKTVHYQDEAGNELATDYTDSVTVTKSTDAVSDEVTYTTGTLKHQANPTLNGYHVITSPAAATTNQTVDFTAGDATYTVVYAQDDPTVTNDTVTKTVHYVDSDGNKLADGYFQAVSFTKSVDALTGEVTYTPTEATLGHQDNPTIKGYHVVTNSDAAQTDQTVQYGAADAEYWVVYAKDAPTVEQDTVTKTVHYVDADGNTLTDDYTDTAEFEKATDAVSGAVTYTSTDATLGFQANPTIKGYHVVTSPAETTSEQTAQYGAANPTYTVVYEKDAPTITVETDTVTKTVHYVDADGNTLADDYTDTAEFEKATDTVSGAVTYTPTDATLGFQANPTIEGYHVVTSPAAATSAQTMQYGATDVTYTVVYEKDAPTVETDTVTKTVHYVDADGNPLANDYVVTAEFEKSTDAVSGEVTYTPTDATLGFQANPTIKGYHVVTNPAEATSAQTVKYGAADATYTVVYEKDASTVEKNTVTKTVHYELADGTTLVDDYVASADFTKSTDATTGEVVYDPETATLGHQDNPTIKGYHVVVSPAAVTADQTVSFGTANSEYTVVYEKDIPTVETDTVTKTVHYVDADGNTLADDYTDTAEFEKSTDAVSGDVTYTPTDATLGFQANPTIKGYHVVTSPAKATRVCLETK